MQFIKLKTQLKDFTVFTLTDIRKLEPKFHRRRLTEWQEKGYIKKIIRGCYIFSDLKLDECALFEIANKIYSPSYISFEMALSYYNLIPESVYEITSATTLRTYAFKTPIAQFSYRTLKPELFFGYELLNYNNKYFKLASPEKAVLDYFYLNPSIKTTADFQSLRFNTELFLKRLDEERFDEYLKRFDKKTLSKRLKDFKEFMKNVRPKAA